MDVDEASFKTLVVVEFSPKCGLDVIEWVEWILKREKERNGTELLTKLVKNSKGQKVYLQIGASIERLLKGAEEICLKKMHKQKSFRDFVIKDLENFEGSNDLEHFLTQSERLKIIDYELSNLKYVYDEIAFENNVKLEPKDSIINQLREQNLIVNVFPLHDKDELKKLEFVWYKSVSSYLPFNLIPLNRIRNYFGESVTFYFQFFEYYTKALYSFALFGLLIWILPLSSFHKFIICSLFNFVWNTLFTEIWKRKSSQSCFEWGNSLSPYILIQKLRAFDIHVWMYKEKIYIIKISIYFD